MPVPDDRPARVRTIVGPAAARQAHRGTRQHAIMFAAIEMHRRGARVVVNGTRPVAVLAAVGVDAQAVPARVAARVQAVAAFPVSAE